MTRVEENIGLARKIAHSYSKYDRTMYDDLFQEACLGLVEADKTYIESESAFSTHAMNVMKFKIMYYLEANNTPGVTSRSAGKIAMKIRKSGMENDSIDKISEELGISKERAVAVLSVMKNKKSLDSNVDEENGPLSNVITDENGGNLIIHEQGLQKLNDLQRTCFKLSTMGYNNEEIASITGLSSRFVGKAITLSREVLKEWSEVL